MPSKPKTPLAELPRIPAELLKSFGDGLMCFDERRQDELLGL